MACDPCIRGHRSTKCDHGDSRVLVKVRKPGRPLTACPHSQSQQCDCPKNAKGCGCSSSITVAIPRKQACGGCKTGPRTVAKTEAGLPEPTIPGVPESTAGNFKVRKTSHFFAQVPRPRPQSYDESFFEGLDPNTVNITTNGRPVSLNAVNGNGTNGHITLPDETVAPGLMQMTTQAHYTMPMNGHGMQQSPRTSVDLGAGMSLHEDSEAITSSLSNNMVGNGHNGAYFANANYMALGPVPQPILSAYPMMANQSLGGSTNGSAQTSPLKGCCSTQTPSPTMGSGNMNGHSPLAPLPPMYKSSDFSQPGFQMYPGLIPQQQTTVYAPQINTCGSSTNPFQAAQWQNNMLNLYNQQLSMSQPQFMHTNGAYGTSNIALDTSCLCGDACQCLGCAVHPYNEAMQAHVRAIYSQMDAKKSEPASPANVQSPDTFWTLPNQASENFSMSALTQSRLVPAVQGQKSCCDSKKAPEAVIEGVTEVKTESQSPSPPAFATPTLSINNSPMIQSGSDGDLQQELQQLDGNDYMFFDYDVGDGCSGEQAGCACGPDCECIGCIIHGNDSSVSSGEGIPTPVLQAHGGSNRSSSGEGIPTPILQAHGDSNRSSTSEEKSRNGGCCG